MAAQLQLARAATSAANSLGAVLVDAVKDLQQAWPGASPAIAQAPTASVSASIDGRDASGTEADAVPVGDLRSTSLSDAGATDGASEAGREMPQTPAGFAPIATPQAGVQSGARPSADKALQNRTSPANGVKRPVGVAGIKMLAIPSKLVDRLTEPDMPRTPEEKVLENLESSWFSS